MNLQGKKKKGRERVNPLIRTVQAYKSEPNNLSANILTNLTLKVNKNCEGKYGTTYIKPGGDKKRKGTFNARRGNQKDNKKENAARKMRLPVLALQLRSPQI